jgi:glycerophosphoryl diester phosphodiesterase
MLDWLTARPIAHRGLHDPAAGIIENTPSAFRAAIEGGYGIECDLQISADGEAMVHHDDALGRLTEGEGRLDTMTAAALKRVPFKGSADRMLTLAELCDLAGGRTTLVIELKGQFPGDTRLAAPAARVLAGQAGPIAAMSFDPALMGLVAMKRAADTPTTARMSALEYLRQMFAAHLQFMAYRVQDLGSVPPLLARNVLGWPLLTWTVRTAADRARAARYADQVIFEGFRP